MSKTIRHNANNHQAHRAMRKQHRIRMSQDKKNPALNGHMKMMDEKWDG